MTRAMPGGAGLTGEHMGIADAAAFVAAIDRDLAAIAADHADKVRKGRLSQQESDYVVGLVRDIRSDLVHAFGAMPRVSIERPDPAVSWRDKVRWISRELDDRRATYPELVAKGRMTEADARLGERIMAHLRRLYWRELFMWEPEPGPALEWLIRIRRRPVGDSGAAIDAELPHGKQQYRELARKHFANVELEDQPQQQRLLA